MNSSLSEHLRAAQVELQPRYQALHAAMAVLKRAAALADEDTLDAIAMHKHLGKLREAAAGLDDPALNAAVESFAAQTQHGLDALAFEFARDLKTTFEQRGRQVQGRPPTLAVDVLALNMDMASRRAQWFYGKEALTSPLPLSLSVLLKAYDQQHKAIVQRTFDVPAFMAELYTAWRDQLAKRTRATAGKRINVVEIYSQVTLNRQSQRFWNSPARSTFKDYHRAHFVRDLVLAQQTPTVTDEAGNTHYLRLGVATKSQADNAMRSIWLPQGALNGEYYADLTFAAE